MNTRARALSTLCLLLLALTSAASPSASAAFPSVGDGGGSWTWPVGEARTVLAPYRAPAHAYGAGHRGIDIGTSIGAVVVAPAEGIVAFRGTVVDRPLVTIEHAGGLVTTFEPVDSSLSPGDAVAAGDPIGTIAAGGHSAPGSMHLGVRRSGAYINPLLMFGDVPRAVLLPCCGVF